MEYSEDKPKVMTVRDMDPDQQPREKALAHGCGVLSVPELFALILRTGTTGNPVTDLCRDLMRANGGKLRRLERRTRQELLEVRGIGTTKAIQIEAVMELIRRYSREAFGERICMKSSKDIADFMRPEIGNLDHEEIWVLFLNRANILIHSERMTSGTDTASLFDVRKIIKTALLENANSLILCHNHPSGNLIPSLQDDQITQRLKEACGFMSISMLDHVILTSAAYYSYRDESRL